jgi:hypothetical protein
MKRLELIFIFFLLISCEEKPSFIEDYVAESFHQAIGLEKIIGIQPLLEKDTIYVFLQKISLLKKTKFIVKDSRMIPSHVDKWKIKIIKEDDLNGYIKTNHLWYLKLFIEEKDDKVIVSMEKAFQYSDDMKNHMDETEGVRTIFEKENIPKLIEVVEYRKMFFVE